MKKFLIFLFFASFRITMMGQNVVQGEYFIDTDLGFGNNKLITLTASPDNQFPLTINLSSYSPGYHKLYIRTKDSNGNWSFTCRRNVEVLASEAKTTFTSGEYFIDTDPGIGMATPIKIISPDSVLFQNFSAVASGLSEGYHKLYGRMMDNLGRWSLTFRKNMEIYKDENNKVVNGEYFFKTDNGFGACLPVIFGTPAADGSFVINIPNSNIPAGADSLFVRVRDDIENRWSFTEILNLNKVLPLTLLDFSGVKESNIVQLHWQTTNEVNAGRFTIQRSQDASHFTNIGTVKAVDQNGINDYSYADNIEGISATKLFYRLQETDIDGRLTYSKIVTIVPDKKMEEIAIYPNPANEYFNIVSSNPDELKDAKIIIIDMSGHQVFTGMFINAASQKISISSLAKGMYIVKIIKVTGPVIRKLVKE